jgi:hypothetical protein
MYYSDNQKEYTNFNQPPMIDVGFDIIARGPARYTNDDDPCDPVSRWVLVGVNTVKTDGQGADMRDIGAVLCRYFQHGCHCDHDCCGHRHGGASVTKWISMDTVQIKTYSSRNY